MAYETGTASGLNDLLDKIRIFALAQGWTVNEYSSTWVSLSDGAGGYFNPYTDVANGKMKIRGATGYAPGLGSDTQPGTTDICATHNIGNGPFVAYHLFGDGVKYIHCVVEYSAGLFAHIVFGTLEKFGVYTGGQYVDAVCWLLNSQGYTNYPDSDSHRFLFDGLSDYAGSYGYLRAEVDGQVWHQGKESALYRFWAGVRGQLDEMTNRSPNTFNLLTTFVPIPVMVERDDDKYAPVGYVPDIRWVNMKFLTPGQSVSIGADTWMVFPPIQKTITWGTYSSTTPSSGYDGYAYKVIP